MATNHNVDLTQIPISALKQSTLVTLSASLNQHKIIPSDNGLPRDWRGLAQLIGLNSVKTNQISVMPDCFSALVNHWGERGNISLLLEYLGVIDRYDVIDDAKEIIIRDSVEYGESPKTVCTIPNSVCSVNDKRILTVDDVIRLEKGLEPQIYDAYILYAEEDSDFATEIIETMENKYNLKLCVRDRDLIGGVQFEHDAITKLIAERCRRLVVIVSSNFLRSKANKFFVTFAQALGIDIRERKVIPILYEHCDVPPELSYYFLLDYNRAGKLWNFWDKLRDSIQTPVVSKNNSLPSSKVSTSVETKSDLWISRTRFEEEYKEPEMKHSEISVTDMKPKKSNIYKLIRQGFSRSKKDSSSHAAEEKLPPVVIEASLIDRLTTLASNNEPSYENFRNSSSFESEKDENMKTKEKNKKVKKKWYRKRAVETLLT